MSKLRERLRQHVAVHTPVVDQQTALLRPPEKTRKEKIRDFFWDKNQKMCMTRTPINWLAISIYYSLFVAGVILIFYISMVIAEAVASRDSKRPQYVLDDSFIGSSPSVNFFPMLNGRNLIWLSDKRDYKKYVSKISKEFESYKKVNDTFNTKQFASCGDPPYGYKDKLPCLFFRMNRILLWKPKPFNKGDKLPEDMPQVVKKKIQDSTTPKVWISCNGTTAKDRDHIKQKVFSVQGDGGFDVSGFPYEKQDGFLDPIVAIQLKDEKPKKILYSFTCTLWANKMDRDVSKVYVNYYFE